MLTLHLRGALVVGAVFTAISAGAQSNYQVISVDNGGTIRGTVKWQGALPRLIPSLINKDPEICDPNGEKRRDLERLVVGPDNGVANTIIYLANITQGKAMNLPEKRQFLNQKTCRYEPHILLVPLDGKLEIKSSDATLHTVHMSGASDYNLPFPFKDRVIERTMNREGLVNLRCNAGHVWMNAEMMVVAHPYYAVTDANGNFELTQVPPGDYEIVAWHEGWKVVGEDAVYDVLTQTRVKRPVFSAPATWTKHVSVTPGDTTRVDFTIGEKTTESAASR